MPRGGPPPDKEAKKLRKLMIDNDVAKDLCGNARVSSDLTPVEASTDPKQYYPPSPPHSPSDTNNLYRKNSTATVDSSSSWETVKSNGAPKKKKYHGRGGPPPKKKEKKPKSVEPPPLPPIPAVVPSVASVATRAPPIPTRVPAILPSEAILQRPTYSVVGNKCEITDDGRRHYQTNMLLRRTIEMDDLTSSSFHNDRVYGDVDFAVGSSSSSPSSTPSAFDIHVNLPRPPPAYFPPRTLPLSFQSLNPFLSR